MKKELKEDAALLSGLAYVIQCVTCEQEYSGGIEIDLRGGGVRDGGPSIPADVDLKVLKGLLRRALPSDGFSGTLCIGSNLGVVNSCYPKVI
jgi:hypothetical protein